MSAIAFISVDGDLCEIADTVPAPAPTPLIDRLMAVKPAGLSLNAWALKAGVNRQIFNDVRKRGNIRHDSLVKLLDAASVSLGQFEGGETIIRSEVRGTGMTAAEARGAWSVRDSPPVPLLGSAFGGDWEDLESVEMTELHLAEVLDYLDRPPSLAGDPEAYCVEIVGESMAPRFEPGERAFVSPRAPARIGDDVVVQLINDSGGEDSDIAREVTMVLIKRLVKRTAAFVELEQFNPPKTFKVPVERIRRIHRVRGRL